MRHHDIEDVVHLLVGLADREATDRIAVEVHRGNRIGMGRTDVLEDTALVDGEEQLLLIHGIRQAVETRHLILTALQPAGRTLDGRHDVLPVLEGRRTLVEGHRDGRAEIGLDLHRLLRAHKDTATIDVAVEGNTLLLDLPSGTGQGEDLESAGVGQDRTIPVHKLVETTELLDELITGTHVQMIGVAELDLGADLPKIIRRHAALDGSDGTDVHEDRCFDASMHRLHVSGFRASAGRDNFILHSLNLDCLILSNADRESSPARKVNLDIKRPIPKDRSLM